MRCRLTKRTAAPTAMTNFIFDVFDVSPRSVDSAQDGASFIAAIAVKMMTLSTWLSKFTVIEFFSVQPCQEATINTVIVQDVLLCW